MLSRTLEDGDPSDRELLQTITHEASRLSRLIESLLQITRIESGGLDVHREWHVVEEVLGSALRRVQEHFPERAIHVRVDPALPLVSIDALLIEQVCVNLLENACQYTPTDKPVSVDARRDGAKLLISVTDEGPGVPDALRERIFEPFARIPGRRRTEGSGLGLAIARQLASRQGATLAVAEARDRPAGWGTGACFVLRIRLMPGGPVESGRRLPGPIAPT